MKDRRGKTETLDWVRTKYPLLCRPQNFLVKWLNSLNDHSVREKQSSSLPRGFTLILGAQRALGALMTYVLICLYHDRAFPANSSGNSFFAMRFTSTTYAHYVSSARLILLITFSEVQRWTQLALGMSTNFNHESTSFTCSAGSTIVRQHQRLQEVSLHPTT